MCYHYMLNVIKIDVSRLNVAATICCYLWMGFATCPPSMKRIIRSTRLLLSFFVDCLAGTITTSHVTLSMI